MNLTKLERRIVRETDVTVDGTPLIISLEVGGQVGLKQKGTRHTLFVSLATLWATLTATEGKAAAVAASKKVVKVEKAEPLPAFTTPMLELMQELNRPIHGKTLEALVGQDLEGTKIQALFNKLMKQRKIKHVAPFHYQAVTSKDNHTTAV